MKRRDPARQQSPPRPFLIHPDEASLKPLVLGVDAFLRLAFLIHPDEASLKLAGGKFEKTRETGFPHPSG